MLKTPENGSSEKRQRKSVRFDEKPPQLCWVNPPYDPIRAALDKTAASNFVRDRVTRFPEAEELAAAEKLAAAAQRRAVKPTKRPPALPPRNNPSTSAAIPDNGALPASAPPPLRRRRRPSWLTTRYLRFLRNLLGDRKEDGRPEKRPVRPPPIPLPTRKIIRAPSSPIIQRAADVAGQTDDDYDSSDDERRPKDNSLVKCLYPFTKLNDCLVF